MAVWTWRATDGDFGRRACGFGCVVAAPACCRVRREHASDAMAGGAAALASEGKRGPRRAARRWQRVRRQPRRGSSGRRTLVVGFHQAGRPNVGRPAGPGSDAVKGVCQRRAQIAGDQAVRLGAQELRPAGADPPRRRPEARAAQHGRDRGRRDADPQPFQLTLDAHVAPLGVLTRQPFDQTARLGRKRGTTEPARPLSPIPLQQSSVPAAKRLRADRKAGPPRGRKQAAGRSEQGSVGAGVLRPLP